MPSTSPIRRYVLLRHRGSGASAPRWSKERIAPAPRDAAPAPTSPQRRSPTGS